MNVIKTDGTAQLQVIEHVEKCFDDVGEMFDLSRGAHVEPGSWMWKRLLHRQSMIDALYSVGQYAEALVIADSWVDMWRDALATPKDWRFENGNLLALDGYSVDEKET